jgi:Lysylphosphatidylglycerol synthase TM region
VAAAARRGRSWPARAARTVATDLHRGLLVRGVWPQVTLASLVVVAGHTATFVVAARVAGSTAPLGELIALLMVVQIAGGIPLSVAGWGPREGVAAWAFAAAGLGAANGVTVATLYAVLMLVAVSPGAGLLLKDAARRRRGRRPRQIGQRGRRPRQIGRRGQGQPGESRGPDPVPLTNRPARREAERLVR